VDADFLHQLAAWVFMPRSVAFSVSSDGRHFTPMGDVVHFQEDRDPAIKFQSATATQPVQARYVRLDVKGVVTCPSWHYGAGRPAWFFIDEITVH